MDYGQKNEGQLIISKYDKPPANSLAVTNELGQDFDGDPSVQGYDYDTRLPNPLKE